MPPPSVDVSITATKRPAPQDGRRVVIERVIKEMTASLQYPMHVNLQAQGLWHAVEPEEEETIEYQEDYLAFAAILRSVPPKMLASLSTKRTAQSAWEGIKSRRVGV